MVLASVVVPTYNEADGILELLQELDAACGDRDIEILVVDDNSPDGTYQKAVEFATTHPRVVPVLRKHEKGLATAVIEGMRRSRGTFVVVMDSDFQHPPQDVPRLVDAAVQEDADCVIGSRYAPGGSVSGFPFVRRVISWGARQLSVWGLPVVRRNNIRDPMSGFFLVRRDRLDVDALQPRGYKILLEVLARAPLRRVAEVGYAFQNRRAGASKLRMKTQVDYFLHVASLAMQDRENRRLFVFALVGITGIVVNLAIIDLLHAFTTWDDEYVARYGGQDYLVGALAIAAVAREAAVLWNFGWNDRVTFKHERRVAHFTFVHRILRFHIVGLWSFLVYLAIYYPLIHFDVLATLGIPSARWRRLGAASLAILAGFFVNYTANLRWTYQPRRKAHEE